MKKDNLLREQYSHSPTLYQAVTLKERIETLRNNRFTGRRTEIDSVLAKKHLERWSSQLSFKNNFSFAQRLAIEKIEENELLWIYGESVEAVKDRFSRSPQWLEDFFQGLFYQPASHHEEIFNGLNLSTEETLFISSIKPFICWRLDRLDSEIQALKIFDSNLLTLDKVKKIICSNLIKDLVLMSRRTLVLELNVARLRGILQGDTSSERFQSFYQRLGQPEEALKLFQEYPVLARQIVTHINIWIDSSSEFISRLSTDWKAIATDFYSGKDIGKLVNIEYVGDRHRNGRSVLLLKFDSGFKIVYKPKSLAIDAHFQELLAWLNEKGNHPPLRTLKILNRHDYGWVEFVSASECNSEQELERFYQRQGFYLALSYVLGGTDFHSENIVAAGEQPVFIDLECLFHPDFKVIYSESHLKTVDIYKNSVTRVGLLPKINWTNTSKFEGVEFSGLGGQKGQLAPDKTLVIEGWGTDRMRFVRKRMEMSESSNLPKLDNREVNILNYLESIIDGFTNYYKLLRKHSAELISEHGFLNRFTNDEIRVILRPTRYYDLLLKESFYPDLLRNALDRDLFFERLWLGMIDFDDKHMLFEAERKDLDSHDIPMFSTGVDSCDLRNSSGSLISSSFFEQSGMNLAKKRLQGLCEQDMNRQLWVIRASLATFSSPSKPKITEKASYSQIEPRNVVDRSCLSKKSLEMAQAIGERLETLAWHEEDRSNWLGLELINNKRWQLTPLNTSLFCGLPGVIIFLGYLGVILKEDRYTNLANSALKTLQNQLQNERDSIQLIGGFDGWGGVIYTFLHLGVLWNRPELLAQAEDFVELLPNLIEKDKQFDVIGGAAGCICSLLSLYHHVRSERIIRVAVQCGEHLLNNARPMDRGIGWIIQGEQKALSGLSHGAAGISMALLMLSETTADERFRTAALQSIEYERSLFVPQQENWLDLRNFTSSILKANKQSQSCMTAWCHGASGIGLARLRLASPVRGAQSLSYLEDSKVRTEIDFALKTTLNCGFGNNHSLCHGDLGNLELFLQANLTFKTPELDRNLNFLATKTLDDIERRGWLGGEPLNVKIDMPGLMNGLAGIGYQLLRLARPSCVPSVLTMERPT